MLGPAPLLWLLLLILLVVLAAMAACMAAAVALLLLLSTVGLLWCSGRGIIVICCFTALRHCAQWVLREDRKVGQWMTVVGCQRRGVEGTKEMEAQRGARRRRNER